MKKTVALLVSAVISGSTLVACTPKPASADPVAQDFLDAMAERDAEALSEVIDNPQSAVQAIDETFTGLQAEGLTTTLADVDVNDSIATARYSMHWNLPRDRLRPPMSGRSVINRLLSTRIWVLTSTWNSAQ